jgi:VRR-NUC domain
MPAKRRAPTPPAERSEIQIQTLFRGRARMQCPTVQIASVPNAGKRGQWAMNQALREGMRAGFPDIICMAPGGLIAFIEFKSAKGVTDPKQLAWIDWLNRSGFPATISRDPDHALEFLRGLGFPFVFPALEAA